MHIYTFCIPLAVYSLMQHGNFTSTQRSKIRCFNSRTNKNLFFYFIYIGGIFGGLEFVIYFTVIGYLIGSLSLYLNYKTKNNDL